MSSDQKVSVGGRAMAKVRAVRSVLGACRWASAVALAYSLAGCGDTEPSASGTAGGGDTVAGAAAAGAAGAAGQPQGAAGSSGSEGGATGSGGSEGSEPTLARVPCGVYLLDADRDLPFVAGVLTTLKWPELEPSSGAYDFTVLTNRVARVSAGKRIAIRMTRGDPDYVAAGAATTWNWIVNNGSVPGCEPPTGCPRAVPWDDFALTRYEAFVSALAQQDVSIGGVDGALGTHPSLESVMLILPGWSRIREQDFELEELPGYTRELLIEGTLRALGAQVNAFPNTPVFTQFFPLDDGAEPPLDEALRDAILGAPELDHVGFYQENMAHSLVEGVETFRPATTVGAPLFTSKDQTFIGLQALTSWADPGENYADAVAGGEPAQAIDWAVTTYNARYFELYAQDVDAALDGGAHPEWRAGFDRVGESLCAP